MTDSLLERGRSKNWTYEETMELINTYTSAEWQSKFNSEKKNHRAIWAEMVEVLTKRRGVGGDEARQRLNNLKALYNRIRRQLIAGELQAPQWEYWEPLHYFLTRPFQQPFLAPPIMRAQPQSPARYQPQQIRQGLNQRSLQDVKSPLCPQFKASSIFCVCEPAVFIQYFWSMYK